MSYSIGEAVSPSLARISGHVGLQFQTSVRYLSTAVQSYSSVVSWKLRLSAPATAAIGPRQPRHGPIYFLILTSDTSESTLHAAEKLDPTS